MKHLTGITTLLLILSVSLHGYPVKEGLSWLGKLNNINCKAAVQLYTPGKVQEGCQRDALECFRKGLHTLTEECSEDLDLEDGSWDIIDNLEEFLNDTVKKMKTSKPTNSCACEAYPKMPLQNFTEHLLPMIQQANSQS